MNVHAFACSDVHAFACSDVHAFACSDVHAFTCSDVRAFACSDVHAFAYLDVHAFACSHHPPDGSDLCGTGSGRTAAAPPLAAGFRESPAARLFASRHRPPPPPGGPPPPRGPREPRDPAALRGRRPKPRSRKASHLGGRSATPTTAEPQPDASRLDPARPP
ncbi:hypothetical protein ACRRTK_018547 [Alexandromys fortis]